MTDAATTAIDGFWLVVVLTVPLAVAAALAGGGVSALARSVGLDDPVVARVARVLAVLLAIGLLIGRFGDRLVAMARADLAAVADVNVP